MGGSVSSCIATVHVGGVGASMLCATPQQPLSAPLFLPQCTPSLLPLHLTLSIQVPPKHIARSQAAGGLPDPLSLHTTPLAMHPASSHPFCRKSVRRAREPRRVQRHCVCAGCHPRLPRLWHGGSPWQCFKALEFHLSLQSCCAAGCACLEACSAVRQCRALQAQPVTDAAVGGSRPGMRAMIGLCLARWQPSHHRLCLAGFGCLCLVYPPSNAR